MKTFQFRIVNFPGVLTLDESNRILSFNSESIGNMDGFKESFDITQIGKVELSKKLLKETLSIYYDGEWYKWTDFLDEHYQQIYRFLVQSQSSSADLI
ncbi:hypothetical protein [Macrococcus hajekii]|nr:hypothetical protein [Macrococcus hajekii]